MNMKNVIVTGGNGFIGSSLIKKLVANGVNVVAVDITFAGDRLPESEFITKIESGVDHLASMMLSIIWLGEV